MRKVIEKGDDYVAKEIQRLEALIASKATNDAKKREFALRVSILKAF